MLKLRLSDAILEDGGGWTSHFYTAGDWYMAYEWLCRKMLELKKTGFQDLNATSSINNSEFNPMRRCDAPLKCIGYLLRHGMGFWKREPSEFLVSLGIRRWSDLDKIILIKGRRPTIFPKTSWFKIRGRRFKGRPNSCHPKAKWVSGFSVQFCHYRKRWTASIDYGYRYDDGWEVKLEQNYHEHLDSFTKRIDAWLEEKLGPENEWEASSRERYERNCHCVRDAWEELFYENDIPFIENEMADLIAKIPGGACTESHIFINKQRLATLKKWAKDTYHKQVRIMRKS